MCALYWLLRNFRNYSSIIERLVSDFSVFGICSVDQVKMHARVLCVHIHAEVGDQAAG